MTNWLSQILIGEVTEQTWQLAEDAELVDTQRAKAFGIARENVREVIETRSDILPSIIPDFEKFCQTQQHVKPKAVLKVLWHLWLPLAIQLASFRQQKGRPFIQGILGGQGTGKTTMCGVLSLIIKQLGYRCLSLSLDDLYKSYSDRLQLRQQDPRLIWRGPPGTHDVELGLTVLEQICNSTSPVAVPRFDKSLHAGAGDRTSPEIVEDVDIVLFEGWFVGVKPIDPALFNSAPPPIVTEEDRAFARDMNSHLKSYLPLWEKLDSLIVLYPEDYHLSLEWRKQAERQMIAAGKSGMTEQEVEQFVYYFWRSLHPKLFIEPLVKYPSSVDFVIEMNRDRTIFFLSKGGTRNPTSSPL
ncbi:hypothetical protein NUACC21_10510 [Scytonema sp. NUACC21]